MRRRSTTALPALALLLSACAAAAAGPERPTPAADRPSIEAKTRGMTAMPGFMPLYWDAGAGKLYLEVPRLDEEVLYVHAMTAGLGSNDVGLDRNQLGGERIVRFERVGPRVLMVQPNYEYRAITANDAERRAVEEAFARSVLWGFDVVAETGGRVLVEATDFALRDVHGVIGSLRRARQGTFRLDKDRSALYLPRTRVFPKNTEIEVTLTFEGEQPGRWVRDVTPTPEAVTVRQRHSFVELPPPGFEARENDPRAGFFGISYLDYATPVHQPIVKRYAARHRLAKQDPSAAVSEPVEPIVYYLDPGVPEPIRSALLDGARWWNEAFEAAGYRDAFRVELLPDTADPMDVRYNVINWVHRATRGWSYGSSVIDPRTGEIIKGHVLLGSLRVRQDYLLAEGLLAPYDDLEDEISPEALATALARIRQLSAHEVGHTLGLAHNYIASTAGRASVMDYPHPLARLTADGRVDLSQAYAEGIGEWDKVAVTWGYQDFPAGVDESAALRRIIAEARERGLLFLTDQDARPAGGAHPRTHLWDNGVDAAAELRRMMQVRRAALERFGQRVIRAGMPLAVMEEALVPLYLHHRYQVEAAAKVLGGKHYTYALRGDDDAEPPLARVPRAQQLAALDALLETLAPSALTLPAPVVEQLPPRPYLYGAHRELFPGFTGLTFDPIAPAAVAAGLTLDMLLNEERSARLVEQKALEPGLPGLDDVLDRIDAGTFGARATTGYEAEVKRTVERSYVDALMELAERARMPQVRALAVLKLHELRQRAERAAAGGPAIARAHGRLIADDIGRFLERPGTPWEPLPELPAPPGSPIGSQGGG